MTRKHFEAIARAIRTEASNLEGSVRIHPTEASTRMQSVKAIAELVATELAGFNGQFDRERFLKACGFED